MTTLFLVCAGVLVALVVLVRIIRRGRGGDFGESKKAFEQRLQKTGAQTREHTLSAGVAEQMMPIAAAIRELLDFAGNPPGFVLLEEGRSVRLQTPAGEIRIDFGLSRMRSTALKRRVGQPHGCWRISGPGAKEEEYMELVDVVVRLKRIISDGQDVLPG